jgi:hypothetical protein
MSGLALAQPPPGTPAGCDPKDSLHEPLSDQVISDFHLVGESVAHVKPLEKCLLSDWITSFRGLVVVE